MTETKSINTKQIVETASNIWWWFDCFMRSFKFIISIGLKFIITIGFRFLKFIIGIGFRFSKFIINIGLKENVTWNCLKNGIRNILLGYPCWWASKVLMIWNERNEADWKWKKESNFHYFYANPSFRLIWCKTEIWILPWKTWKWRVWFA